ncbi:MAG: efflux RND transporter periplasmic adaptor subunit [Bacteroidetes bacterium]|nr:MAG: efflux RND transporter periplasmic adaptor subunit [Bacteroidota bacterium]
MKNRRWIFIVLGIGLVALLGWQLMGSSPKEASELLISPQKGLFQVTVNTTGELRAKNSIDIRGPRQAQTVGIYQMSIASLVEEGTVVEAGDQVASLDPAPLKTKIAEAELALEKARTQYTQAILDTALTLSEKRNAIVNLEFDMEVKEAEMEQSKFEAPSVQQQVKLAYDRAKRAYDQAVESYAQQVAKSVAQVKEKEADMMRERNQLAELQKLLEAFTIKAPAPGMVIYYRDWGGRKRTVGSTIEPWNPTVATLPDLSVMESLTYVNEIDIQKIEKGQSVKVTLDAMPDKALNGRIREVANIGRQSPNSDSKVFEVVIELTDKDTTLRPAMTTGNEILIAEKAEALFIPLEALHANDSLSYVFKREGGSIVRQEVQVGMSNENDVEILAGLKTEDRIYLSIPEVEHIEALTLIRLENPTPPLAGEGQ